MKSNINGVLIYVPKSHAGVIPPSPSNDLFKFEEDAFHGIASLIKPGMIVFDIGVSYGVMTALMAELVGASGFVCSFEANPEVVPYQAKLVEENKYENRVELNNFLVSDVSGEQQDFYIVPGFRSVSSTRAPGIVKFHKNAKKVSLESISIDEYCKRTGRKPQLIKLDIEGAEYSAIQGMQKLISEYHPDLIIETHGLEIEGVSGSVTELVNELVGMGYELFDLGKRDVTTPDLYVNEYERKIGNLLASTKLNENQILDRLKVKAI